jgi:hypothetical protein
LIERIAAETDPESALRRAGLRPSTWSAPPFAHFANHRHESTKRLYVIEGDISFNGEWLRSPAGIRIGAQTDHSADAGEHGVRCIEAFE